MVPIVVDKHNVGRIAERTVANELESRGFRVSDLNKEGISANADLIAARNGRTWQIQVKGATYDHTCENGWWINYGFCDDAILEGTKGMFNRVSGFYKAEVVVLVCVKTLTCYKCVVFPLRVATDAAELNLKSEYRTLKRDGSPKRAGRVYASLGYTPKALDASKMPLREAEQRLLSQYLERWDLEEMS